MVIFNIYCTFTVSSKNDECKNCELGKNGENKNSKFKKRATM